MNKQATVLLLGWIGVLAILFAYAGSVFSWFPTTDMKFLLLNGVGAIFLSIQTFQKKDFPPMVLNVVWVVIAMVGILQVLTR